MKGYYIEVANNLLDPIHQKNMGQSVWLFMWFLDKMTSINEEGTGSVLGGKPIKFEEVVEDLGVSERTYGRWISILKKNEYITATRTPYGYSVKVHKAKKRFAQRYDKNGVSGVKRDTTYTPRDTTKVVGRYDKVADVIKTRQGQDKDIEDKIQNKMHLPPKEKIQKIEDIGNFVRSLTLSKKA